MRKFLFVFLMGSILFLNASLPVQAQTQPQQTYLRGKVIDITSETREDQGGEEVYTQDLQVERADTREHVAIQYGSQIQPITAGQRLTPGDEVVIVSQPGNDGKNSYSIVEKFRLPIMIWLTIGFFALVAIVARKQGIFAIGGMFLSLAMLLYFVVPQIMQGQNPLLITLIGSSVVAVMSIYASHGFNIRSHISLASMMITLVAVGVLSMVAVHLGNLAGFGSEEATYLQFSTAGKINLQGLLLGGIIIGALGVLDDICLAQVSLIYQLYQAKPHISFGELYQRGLTVGKDHVASLVNTLILAYVAGSLPLFLLFTMSQQPAWVTLNSEIIAEEVIRTVIGSIGLVLAVPITTFFASYVVFTRGDDHQTHTHHH